MPDIIEQIKENVDAIDKKFDGVNEKFAELENKLKERETFEKTMTEHLESIKTLVKEVQSWKSAGKYEGVCPSAEHAKAIGMAALATFGTPFAKQWLESNDTLIKAMGEGSDPAGGYLVAPEYSATLLGRVSNFGVFRRNTFQIPMGSSKMYIPKRGNGFVVYNPAEGSPLTGSDATLGQTELSAELWGILAIFSKQLEEDAVIVLGEFITREMVRAFAQKEDDVAFNGDGTASYFGVTGLINSLGAAGTVESNQTDKTLKHIDFTNLCGTLPENADAEAKFYMHRTWFFQAMAATDSNGDPIVRDLLIDGVRKPTLMGYPVEITQKMPSVSATSATDVFILLGDLRLGSLLGQRSNVEFARSEDFKFAEVQSAIRTIVRQDIVVYDAGDASDAGAYVGLKLKSA